MRTVFVNPERCIGCLQCELACAVEHSSSQDETVAFLETPVPRKRVHVEAGPVVTFSFPNRCRHCDPAPCLQVCPTGAIIRDDEHGLVLVEPKRCIGCAMCAAVCPFDVLTFHPLADGPGPDIAVAVKCDGCIERMRRGETPACSEVCKVDALVFGELNELMTAGRLRETGAVLAAAGVTPTGLPDEVLRWQEGADLRAVYLRDDKIIGAQVAGDIRAAGVYHSLMMQRIPVDRYGRRLVEPGFGMADIVFEALGHGSTSRSAA